MSYLDCPQWPDRAIVAHDRATGQPTIGAGQRWQRLRLRASAGRNNVSCNSRVDQGRIILSNKLYHDDSKSPIASALIRLTAPSERHLSPFLRPGR